MNDTALREQLRLAIDHISALNGAIEDLVSLGATVAICGTKYDDEAARAVLATPPAAPQVQVSEPGDEHARFEAAMRDYGHRWDFLRIQGSPNYAYVEPECAFQGWHAHAIASPPAAVPADTERLDFMQATEQTPWRVQHDELVWSTAHPERKEKRRVFDGWSAQMEVDDPYPTIRAAIDAAKSAHQTGDSK